VGCYIESRTQTTIQKEDAMSNRLDFWRGSNWNPFRDIMSLQRNMDKMLESMPVDVMATTAHFNPACDIEESDTHYLVCADLPGVPKENIKVDVTENQLIISGDRQQERKDTKSGTYVTERFSGHFERRFSLPTSIDADKIEAAYQDGVLRIALPKSAYAQARQVKIGEGKLTGALGRLFSKKEDKAVAS